MTTPASPAPPAVPWTRPLTLAWVGVSDLALHESARSTKGRANRSQTADGMRDTARMVRDWDGLIKAAAPATSLTR